MSSEQPASAASAAAEASAGDPRFAQLLFGAYQWLETNGSSLLADMDYLAQNTRPGGQQPTDKYIALLDVRVPNGASVQNISYEDLPKEPVLITYDPGAGPLLVKRLAKIYEDWDFPKEYAEMRAKETAVVMADVGGVVLAIGDEPSPLDAPTMRADSVKLDSGFPITQNLSLWAELLNKTGRPVMIEVRAYTVVTNYTFL